LSVPAEAQPKVRRTRVLLVGSVVYLALTFGVMLWQGISIEPEWVLLVLLVIAVALGRGRTFITDWTPFLLLFLAYEAMRGYASKTNFAPHDLSGMERWLFAGTIPTLTLQHAFYHAGVVGLQDIIAMIFYFMHFVLPIVVGFVFWVTNREYYWRFIAALLLMCFLAFVTYLFWPSAPPWYQLHDALGNPAVVKINDQTVQSLWGFTAVTPLYHSFNPNKFAAFPSLHAAFPMLATVYAWQRYRLLAVGLALWSVAVMVSIVYLGEHYVVDALVSILYVAAATIIVETFSRRRGRGVPGGSTPARPSA
jgi:membrane-associated phospholipid phosphatase